MILIKTRYLTSRTKGGGSSLQKKGKAPHRKGRTVCFKEYHDSSWQLTTIH